MLVKVFDFEAPTASTLWQCAERSVTVTHEDLREVVVASTPAHLLPEVFALVNPHRVTNVYDGKSQNIRAPNSQVARVLHPKGAGVGIWVQHLSEHECWDLLAATPVGRLGVLVDSAPEIYPINYLVDHHTIVFGTDPGTKLRGLTRSPAVCIEADGLNAADRTGWSVLVKGRAQVIDKPRESRRLATLPVSLWELGPKSLWVRVVPEEITGRRLDRLEQREPFGAAAGPPPNDVPGK